MNFELVWNELKQYVEDTMAYNRGISGKFDKKNLALWMLKKKMQELDPAITNVGETFDEHENANYDVR